MRKRTNKSPKRWEDTKTKTQGTSFNKKHHYTREIAHIPVSFSKCVVVRFNGQLDLCRLVLAIKTNCKVKKHEMKLQRRPQYTIKGRIFSKIGTKKKEHVRLTVASFQAQRRRLFINQIWFWDKYMDSDKIRKSSSYSPNLIVPF